ncbi:hypothetical protein C0993_009844 [Termitomyces sp. T159_Od127]|nr:hypothetical protein C0993_009844 [Termitomyces sp. T159_Od127]
MSPVTRTSSRPPPSGANTSGTPKMLRLIPTHSDLKTLLVSDSGLVKSLPEARKWLETNGWILAAEPYDCTKLVSILATAALYSKPAESKNTVLAIAFLLEADITDQVSSTLVDTFLTKAMGRLSSLVVKLGSTAEFLVANDAQRAESTLALKSTSETLAGVTTSLEAMVSKLASPPQQPIMLPTWASIAKASATQPNPNPLNQPTAVSALPPEDKVQVQQRVLRDARMVLIKFNPMDNAAPSDLTISGTAKLCKSLNKTLKELDSKETALAAAEDGEVEVSTPRTHAIGLKLVNAGVYLTEFDTADLADRFCHYSITHWEVFNGIFGNSTDIIAKTYNLIARFVPCESSFDPDDFHCLRTIELENGLPSMSITSALWLRNPDL